MRTITIYVVFFFFLPTFCPGQRSTEDSSLVQQLLAMNLSFAEPVDSDYQPQRVQADPYVRYDYAIRSKKEDMEIRYALRPFDPSLPRTQYPNLTVFSALSSAATNSQEAVISQISIPQKEVEEVFGADWGILYQFTPKPGFSEAPMGRLLAIYKEEVGLALVFFFFDDPNNPAIDLRYPAVYFH